VAALEGGPARTTPTTLPPSGPAGGVLTGAYPNPSGLAKQSVGAAALKNTYERVSDGTHLAASTFGDAAATCDPGDLVIGGGYAWQNDAGTDRANNANGTAASSDTTASTPNISAGGF